MLNKLENKKIYIVYLRFATFQEIYLSSQQIELLLKNKNKIKSAEERRTQLK